MISLVVQGCSVHFSSRPPPGSFRPRSIARKEWKYQLFCNFLWVQLQKQLWNPQLQLIGKTLFCTQKKKKKKIMPKGKEFKFTCKVLYFIFIYFPSLYFFWESFIFHATFPTKGQSLNGSQLEKTGRPKNFVPCTTTVMGFVLAKWFGMCVSYWTVGRGPWAGGCERGDKIVGCCWLYGAEPVGPSLGQFHILVRLWPDGLPY